jgi:hypothetical protein
VLIDAKDVIVHIFRPEVRQFYALEKMWTFDSSGAPQRAEGAPLDARAERTTLKLHIVAWGRIGRGPRRSWSSAT